MTDPHYSVHPEFVQLPSGKLFSISVRPKNTPEALVIFVPPFAEEMNKSRKMVNLAMRALAARGSVACYFDFFGTGDSAGGFEQASWARWRDNLAEFTEFCVRQYPQIPLRFVAIRTGALLLNDTLSALTPDWARQLDVIQYWNPVLNPNQFIGQFLRLRLANEMMRDTGNKMTVKDLRAQMEAEGSIEVAGYALHRDLIGGMEEAAVELPQQYAKANLVFHEVSPSGNVSPGLERSSAKVSDNVTPSQLRSIAGPQFWTTQEIALCQPLIDATVSAMTSVTGGTNA